MNRTDLRIHVLPLILLFLAMSLMGCPPANQVSVPNLIGMTQAGAVQALSNAGLTVGTIANANSATVPAGNVMAQAPTAGASVANGSSVSLTISLGSSNVTVPNVMGMAQAAAVQALINAGLASGTVSTAASATVPAGNVMAQAPAAGASVANGSSVNLTISSGSGNLTVPNVMGMTLAAAEQALINAGLASGTISSALSVTVPAGNVMGQVPAAGASVASGSAVNLTISLGGGNVTVPNVMGMAQAAAVQALINAGLASGMISTAASATVPAGNVMAQAPAAGASVANGTAVNLTISSGSGNQTVPNVVGMTQAHAVQALVNAGLTVGTMDTEYSDTVPEGEVIAQDPPAFASVPNGSEVNLTVSLGVEDSGEQIVPDVVGMTEPDAVEALADAGLSVGTIDTEFSDTVPEGEVISQDPPAGTSVPDGSEVDLTISLGSEGDGDQIVPDVVGMTEPDAVEALNGAGLSVGTMDSGYSDTVPAGSIIAQDPPAGALVPTGTEVNLTISLGNTGEEHEAGDTAVFGGITFVWCPPGSFTMGSPNSEPSRYDDEGPQHSVTFAQGFWMAQTEITQAQWFDVMGTTPSYFTGDNLPVEQVTWNDAAHFVNALNAAYPGLNFRLPSEAEWEYACRAGSSTTYYWGDDIYATDAEDYAWYSYNSGEGGNYRTHEVGSRLPNAWGLFDMAGNVFEWVEDWYHDSYIGAPTDGSAWNDPEGYYGIIRGGSYYGNASYLRSARRYFFRPIFEDTDVGFRIAR